MNIYNIFKFWSSFILIYEASHLYYKSGEADLCPQCLQLICIVEWTFGCLWDATVMKLYVGIEIHAMRDYLRQCLFSVICSNLVILHYFLTNMATAVLHGGNGKFVLSILSKPLVDHVFRGSWINNN